MEFTVYIPLYNGEDTIENAIKSVISQTFQDYELLVVNDGSTDRSPAIVERLMEKHQQIRLVNQENKGLFHARTTAFTEAKGNYVVALDADDPVAPNLLETLHQAIIKHPGIDLIEYCLKRTDFKSAGKIYHKDACYYEGGMLPDYYCMMVRNKIYYSQCTKAIRREILLDISEIKDLDRISMGEDFIHTLDYLWRIKKALVIDEPLYLYRYTMTSITNQFKPGIFDDLQQAYYAMLRFNAHTNNLLSEQNVTRLIKLKVGDALLYTPTSVKGSTGRIQYVMAVKDLYKNEVLMELIRSDVRVSAIRAYPLALLKGKHFYMLLVSKLITSRVRRVRDLILMKLKS